MIPTAHKKSYFILSYKILISNISMYLSHSCIIQKAL